MNIASAEFVTGAVRPHQYPPTEDPEIAFAGRSNVGKSSLINTLVNRKRLVKTSSTPGRTQQINFFRVNGSLSLVDLPGYGYARVPPAIQRQWGPMVEAYLTGRANLRGVIVILDIRRTPGIEDDQLLSWLDHHGIAYRVVVTKVDKLSKPQGQKRLAALTSHFPPERPPLLAFSARTRLGREAVWSAICDMIGEAP